MPPKEMTILRSKHGPEDTADRLCAAVKRRDMMVIARIDHAAAAARVGLTLRPTEVIIFGNPLAGTRLMQRTPTLAIDLPLKALVWQDEQERTWLGYVDPETLVRRHGADTGVGQVVLTAMLEALNEVAQETTGNVSDAS